MLFKMFGNAFQCEVVAAGKNDGGLFRFWEDHFLQEQRVRFGTVELLGHLARFADLAHFDQIRGFKREDVVTNPCRRLFQGPREMRKRGGGRHEEPENVHAAGICHELDIPERMNGVNFLHHD